MKKRYLLFLFIVFIFSTRNVKAKDIHIVGLGDSITTGYGVSKEDSYFYLLVKEIDKKNSGNVVFENLSQNGLTSTQLLSQLGNESVQEKVRKTDYIFMSIGGNDFLEEFTTNYQTYFIPKETYTSFEEVKNNLLANMDKITRQIYDLNPDCKVILVPLYNPYRTILGDNENLLKQFDDAKSKYIEVVKQVKNMEISDELGTELEKQEYLNTTGMKNLDPHPNQKGHELIFKMEKELLEESGIIEKSSNNTYLLFIG
ncbi:MAG: hypothetical protein KH135_03220, partial [Firmicutes bacterium]|nr:hypothetical protein [Bacillota bacterium]